MFLTTRSCINTKYLPCNKNIDGVDMEGITEQMLSDAFEEFKERCENDYFIEYFWYPSHKQCWINNWDNDGKAEDAVAEYPSRLLSFKQGSSQWFLEHILNKAVFPHLPGKVQFHIYANDVMKSFPARTINNPIVTPLINGIHFRRGIHNTRVSSMEWNFPM